MNMVEKISPRSDVGLAVVEVGLNAAIVSIQDVQPQVLVVRDQRQPENTTPGLPFGPFSPLDHRTLEIGLRSWVAEQAGLDLGYVEQLYSFGDRGRHARPGDHGPHVVSVGYLALTRATPEKQLDDAGWSSWYTHFPWEDWREGRPSILMETIEPMLLDWATRECPDPNPLRGLTRTDRVRMCFGLDGTLWDEEKVLDRYELLYEAGMLKEAETDDRLDSCAVEQHVGQPLQFDHRRILATAMGRLRAKIKYRPVVFELMPEVFTLFELQRTVEAILGSHLHKQNFRRLVESAGLVEPNGEVRNHTGGRPAKLFGFRREVLLERPAPGVRVKPVRA